MNLSKQKLVALKAAFMAERILLKYYGKKEHVKRKPNKSLVADADLESNKAIIETIKKNFPSHNILSEETGFEDNKSEYRWIIDPLDGTHNFLRKIDIFGTSIALEYKNEVVLGILHFPLLNLTAFAEKGKGAFLNGKRIKVSGKKTLDHSFVLIEFSYAEREKKIGFLNNFINHAIDIRNFGSAVHNLMLVASGKSDAYVVLSTNEWDVAAGFLIVEEAGGKITDLEGKKWNFGEKKYVISNGKLHNQILKYFKGK